MVASQPFCSSVSGSTPSFQVTAISHLGCLGAVMREKEIDERYDIVAYPELVGTVHRRVKSYASGVLESVLGGHASRPEVSGVVLAMGAGSFVPITSGR